MHLSAILWKCECLLKSLMLMAVKIFFGRKHKLHNLIHWSHPTLRSPIYTRDLDPWQRHLALSNQQQQQLIFPIPPYRSGAATLPFHRFDPHQSALPNHACALPSTLLDWMLICSSIRARPSGSAVGENWLPLWLPSCHCRPHSRPEYSALGYLETAGEARGTTSRPGWLSYEHDASSQSNITESISFHYYIYRTTNNICSYCFHMD